MVLHTTRVAGATTLLHPELRGALRALSKARTALQKATHDHSGERVEALKDTIDFSLA